MVLEMEWNGNGKGMESNDVARGMLPLENFDFFVNSTPIHSIPFHSIPWNSTFHFKMPTSARRVYNPTGVLFACFSPQDFQNGYFLVNLEPFDGFKHTYTRGLLLFFWKYKINNFLFVPCSAILIRFV